MLLLRRLYGASPWHLVLCLLGLLLAGLAVQTMGLAELWDGEVWWQSIAVWFVGALLLHDLVLFPFYAGADRVVARVGASPAARVDDAPSPRNHVRLALAGCGLVSLLFFPGVLRRGADSYLTATGMTQEPFALRWALLCLGLCLLSAVTYVVRRRLHRRDRGPRPAV